MQRSRDRVIRTYGAGLIGINNECTNVMLMAGIHLLGQQKNSKMPLHVYRVKISMRGRGGAEVDPFWGHPIVKVNLFYFKC